jgi:hypothetical protein
MSGLKETKEANAMGMMGGVGCEVCGLISRRRCGQCRKKYYCGVDCQVSDWAVHRQTCRSDLADEFLHLLKDNRGGLLDFLNRGKNGQRDTLRRLFHQIETTTDDPIAILRWSLHPSKIDSIYEWPTDELCHCITAILKFEKHTRIIEHGAGTGLLTARLNHFSQRVIKENTNDPKKRDGFKETDGFKENTIVCEASNPVEGSKGRSRWLYYNKYTANLFGTVKDEAMCDNKEMGTPVLISWIDSAALPDLDQLMLRNKPKLMIAISYPWQSKQRTEMIKSGVPITGTNDRYSVTYISAKQLSYHDRSHVSVAPVHDSRTILTIYRLNLPSFTAQQVDQICMVQNLGSCASLDDKTMAQLEMEDFLSNLKHDPKGELACNNHACKSCSHTFKSHIIQPHFPKFVQEFIKYAS